MDELLDQEAGRMRGALARILHNEGDRCSNSTGPFRWDCRMPHSGRTRDALYGADRWCDACIASEGLGFTAQARVE
jgi:hypothetical protein